METLWDRNGRVVGWIDDDRLRSLDGRVIGWLVSDELVYSLRGQHVGWFEEGQFWDLKGHVVTFAQNATSGPSKPELSDVPAVPALSAVPGTPGMGAFTGSQRSVGHGVRRIGSPSSTSSRRGVGGCP
ncbi:4-fold beta flower protein [Microbacterium sufflavum]|uniref:4-fold beta flower protein n=1 Tax=Microbacterium sufflavum TaxID=2851649 RepID=UPI003558FC27